MAPATLHQLCEVVTEQPKNFENCLAVKRCMRRWDEKCRTVTDFEIYCSLKRSTSDMEQKMQLQQGNLLLKTFSSKISSTGIREGKMLHKTQFENNLSKPYDRNTGFGRIFVYILVKQNCISKEKLKAGADVL